MPMKQLQQGRTRFPTRGRPRKTDGSTLTGKQTRFVAEYLVDLNATQAAVRAGYAAPSASVTAARLLKHPAVAVAVEARDKVRALALLMKHCGLLTGHIEHTAAPARTIVVVGPGTDPA